MWQAEAYPTGASAISVPSSSPPSPSPRAPLGLVFVGEHHVLACQWIIEDEEQGEAGHAEVVGDGEGGGGFHVGGGSSRLDFALRGAWCELLLTLCSTARAIATPKPQRGAI